MINFEEELKKFKPCLEVDGVEEAVKERDLSDVIDLLRRDALRSAPVPEKPAGAPAERHIPAETVTSKEDKEK